jgi:hypothetical protein
MRYKIERVRLGARDVDDFQALIVALLNEQNADGWELACTFIEYGYLFLVFRHK